MAQLLDLGALRFNFTGVYAAGTTYATNDIVRYNNALYVYAAKVAASGNLPTDTTRWKLLVPSGASFAQGTLAARPAAGTAGALYLITGDADAGVLYIDNGATWSLVGQVQHLLRVLAAAAGEVPLTVAGFAAQTGDLARFVDSSNNVLTRVSARGAVLPPIAPTTTFGLDSAANGYRPLTITVTSAGGATLSTATLTYDATTGNLTSIVTVADGRTITKTLTYDANGNLASSTEAITAGV